MSVDILINVADVVSKQRSESEKNNKKCLTFQSQIAIIKKSLTRQHLVFEN